MRITITCFKTEKKYDGMDGINPRKLLPPTSPCYEVLHFPPSPQITINREYSVLKHPFSLFQPFTFFYHSSFFFNSTTISLNWTSGHSKPHTRRARSNCRSRTPGSVWGDENRGGPTALSSLSLPPPTPPTDTSSPRYAHTHPKRKRKKKGKKERKKLAPVGPTS